MARIAPLRGEHRLLELLEARLAPGGLMLLVGKQPAECPDMSGRSGYKRWAALEKPLKLVLDTKRIRDVAMLLVQQRPYREFPRAAAEEGPSRILEVVSGH